MSCGGSEKCPRVPGYSPKSKVLSSLRTLHLLANRVSGDRDIKVSSMPEQEGSSGDWGKIYECYATTFFQALSFLTSCLKEPILLSPSSLSTLPTTPNKISPPSAKSSTFLLRGLRDQGWERAEYQPPTEHPDAISPDQ